MFNTIIYTDHFNVGHPVAAHRMQTLNLKAHEQFGNCRHISFYGTRKK